MSRYSPKGYGERGCLSEAKNVWLKRGSPSVSHVETDECHCWRKEVIPPYRFGQRLNLIEAWIRARLTRHQFGRWADTETGETLLYGNLQTSPMQSIFELISLSYLT
jgi:hypothetical protein